MVRDPFTVLYYLWRDQGLSGGNTLKSKTSGGKHAFEEFAVQFDVVPNDN